MSIKKTYFKTKSTCKVNFRLNKDDVNQADKIQLVGDFNSWDTTANPFRKLKDGSFSAFIELEKGNEYQFRYYIDDERWENDGSADRYVETPYADAQNSVVVI